MRVPITWGRGVGRARRGGLTFGSYDPVLALIRIHPVLDRPGVPRFFLESVVHHEMLHHHMGGVPDRAGPHRLPHARVPRGRGALPAPPRRPRLGEGEPPGAAARQPGARPRAPGRAGRGARRVALGARDGAAAPPAAAARSSRRHRRPLVLGPPGLALTTALSVASPWVLRHAIDDLTRRRDPPEALALRGSDPRARVASRASSATRCG